MPSASIPQDAVAQLAIGSGTSRFHRVEEMLQRAVGEGGELAVVEGHGEGLRLDGGCAAT